MVEVLETGVLVGKSLENEDSVTIVNYDYEIGEYAFQYGKIKTLNIIGGNPQIGKSAFSSCEKLKTVTFESCNLQIDEYGFFGIGKDAEITFTNCTGIIDDYAFQYSEMVSLTIDNSNLEINKSAFSSCEDTTSLLIKDSTITTEEYAFFGFGDSASVEMSNCTLDFDDRTFQYSSIESLTINGPSLTMGDSVFSSCEDMSAINLDSNYIEMGEYAFYGCEDLLEVTICDNSKTYNEISIDDRAFQYCEELESVIIGNGKIDIGVYVFSGCADNLTITIAGNTYSANQLDKGLKN